MKFEDLKIGMEVKANKISNCNYLITTERNNCKGKVVRLLPEYGEFELLITRCDGFEQYINDTFEVKPEYFEPVVSEKEAPEIKESLLLECIKGTTGFEAFKFDDISVLDTIIDSLEKTKEAKKEELAGLAVESAVAFTEVEFANRQGMATDDLRTKAILIQLNMAHTKVTISDIEEQIKNLKKLKEIVTE